MLPTLLTERRLSGSCKHLSLMIDEAWLSDAQTFETDAKRGTLGNTSVEALGEDGETASLSTDCLQEDLSSSDDDDFRGRRWSK
eukprot:4633195-Amphidinium_carterae.1